MKRTQELPSKTKILISVVLLLLSIIILGAFSSKIDIAYGVSAADFKPGRIMDDTVFYNSSAMNTSQIQSFLEARRPTCDTNGTKSRSYYFNSSTGRVNNSNDSWVTTTRAVYGQRLHNWRQSQGLSDIGTKAPYICLKDYSVSVPAYAGGGSNLCTGSMSSGIKTAAQIINDVAKSCGINPQVLIVLLEKEQGLVSDEWPWGRQYRTATGYGCPDTAQCNSLYYGLYNQVFQAAQAFQRYTKNPNSYNYRAGRNNTILWHPNASCGTSTVYIENQATANLYIYTPYRPNQAALNSYPGTGNSCSSYGNRNFWFMFNNWFGSTTASFSPLVSSRIMQIKQATRKVHLQSNEQFGPELSPGAQTYFVDKIFIHDSWFARTEFDYSNGNFDGIPVEDIEDIPIHNISPVWISVDANSEKTDPLRRAVIGPVYVASAARILSKITVGGTEYLRTEFDHLANRTHFIRADRTVGFKFYGFDNPRILASSKAATKVDVLSGSTISTAPAKKLFSFEKKVVVGGTPYIQTSQDGGTNYAYKFTDFTEITSTNIDSYFVPLDSPRWMQLVESTHKIDLPSQQANGPSVPGGTQSRFVDKVLINSTWYARTFSDKYSGAFYVVPASNLMDIPAINITPVWMSITSKTRKIDPTRGDKFEAIDDLAAARFVSKMSVDGKEYYRTAYEQDLGRLRFIPAEALGNFAFFDFAQPRHMITKATSERVNVQTGATVSSIAANTVLFFNKRVTINGVLYAQAQSDNGTLFAVKASALRDS